MKTAKRIQLLLSPVLIAMLSLMLAVVSFGWYMAEMGDVNIETENSSVGITVEAPAYIDVDLSDDPIGDNYKYQEVEVDGKKVSQFTIDEEKPTIYYFGQTGEYDYSSENDDRPYVVFYSVKITAYKKYIDVNSAYINGVEIKKQDGTIESDSDWEKGNSKFKVYFYDYDESERIFSNQREILDVEEESTEISTYIGIHFDDPNSSEAFAYSDIEYYGSTYELKLKFILE